MLSNRQKLALVIGCLIVAYVSFSTAPWVWSSTPDSFGFSNLHTGEFVGFAR